MTGCRGAFGELSIVTSAEPSIVTPADFTLSPPWKRGSGCPLEFTPWVPAFAGTTRGGNDLKLSLGF